MAKNQKNRASIFWKITFFVFFSPFLLGPTGIKGATDQMLPWKAPTDLKTLPMGILHDYMSCWTTLGPFGYPRGPQNGPKQHQNGLEWLEITRMAQNGTAWPQMTLNTSHRYMALLYVMLDHPGPFSKAHGGPKIAPLTGSLVFSDHISIRIMVYAKLFGHWQPSFWPNCALFLLQTSQFP